MARSSHFDSETTPITTASTLSRLLGQAGALLLEAGRLVAQLELEREDEPGARDLPAWWEAPVHVDVDHWPTADADREGEGGRADGGAGGSVLGSPHPAQDFFDKTGLPGDDERRLLVSLVEPDVTGKRVPSPWERVP